MSIQSETQQYAADRQILQTMCHEASVAYGHNVKFSLEDSTDFEFIVNVQPADDSNTFAAWQGTAYECECYLKGATDLADWSA